MQYTQRQQQPCQRPACATHRVGQSHASAQMAIAIPLPPSSPLSFIVTANPCRIAVLTFIAIPAVSAVINCGAQLTNTQHKQKIMLLPFFLEIYAVIGTQQRPLR